MKIGREQNQMRQHLSFREHFRRGNAASYSDCRATGPKIGTSRGDQRLVERGLVEVRRGKGTFVTQPKITQELTELTGFVEDNYAGDTVPVIVDRLTGQVRPAQIFV